jgi:hypothetical protein
MTGVAVYLEPAVLEAVLEQFRQVARAGSRPAILPHYPMVLHRGGYPDGS